MIDATDGCSESLQWVRAAEWEPEEENMNLSLSL